MTTSVQIQNEKADQFERFIEEFDLTSNFISRRERDFWTTFSFDDLTDEELSWIQLEADQVNG